MVNTIDVLVNEFGINREFYMEENESIKTLYLKLKGLKSKIEENTSFLIGTSSYTFKDVFNKKLNEFYISDDILMLTILFKHPLGLDKFL